MKLKILVFTVFCLLSFGFPANGQVPKVRFYPDTELTFCKGCFGRFTKSDGWEFKFRLENHSEKDLIVYGSQFDGEFLFTNTYQYKNPDICEWQYPYGSSEKRCGWKCVSQIQKNKVILKAGETIETRGAAIENRLPERVIAYIAETTDEEPHEIFSEPYYLVRTPAINNSNSENNQPILKVGDEECTPKCDLLMEDAADILGIRLGMSLEDFKKRFPKTEISELHKDKYNYRMAYVWRDLRSLTTDVTSLNINFLDDKVARIEVQLKSLRNTRHRTDFYQLVSEAIKMPRYWKPFRQGWECQDFFIDVLTNEMPTITIMTKHFTKVRDKINEDALRNRK